MVVAEGAVIEIAINIINATAFTRGEMIEERSDATTNTSIDPVT